MALERPADPTHGDYATTIALRLARQLKRSPRDIAAELASRIASDDVEAVEVAGPGLPQPAAVAGLVPPRAGAHPRGGRPLRRGAAGAGAAAAGGVRVGQPDGRPHGRLGPQRGVRRLRRRACWSSPATRSRASTTSTTPAGRSSCSASRCARAGWGRSRRRAATRGRRSPRSPRSSPLTDDAPLEEWARARHGAHDRPHPPDAGAHPRRHGHLVLGDASCTPRAPSSGPSSGRARPATSRSATARPGCARRRSATTRTACWCAPTTASRRTSRPTSRTSTTRSAAATSACCTCSAPTTTATSSGCRRRPACLGHDPEHGRGAAVPDDHGLRRAHGQAPRQRRRASTSWWTPSAWTRRATSSWRARTTSRWTSTSTSPSSSRARTRSTTSSTPTPASAASCARSWRRASRSRPTRRTTSRSGRSATSSSASRSGRRWCRRRPSGARRTAWSRGCTTSPADFHVVHHDLLVLEPDPVGARLPARARAGDGRHDPERARAHRRGGARGDAPRPGSRGRPGVVSRPARPGVRAEEARAGSGHDRGAHACSPRSGSCCATPACGPCRTRRGSSASRWPRRRRLRDDAWRALAGGDGGAPRRGGGDGRRRAGRARHPGARHGRAPPAPRAGLRASGSTARCAAAASAGG